MRPKHVYVIVSVIAFVVFLMEWDRIRSQKLDFKWYYWNSFPLPILGMYNSIVRMCHPLHRHKFDPSVFPSHYVLKDAWQGMRYEAMQIYQKKDSLLNLIQLHQDGFDKVDLQTPGQKDKWKVFLLKWYDKPLENAKRLCPYTVSVIEQCPDVHVAMFSILEPGKYIPMHRGPFTGCLRYHLGLSIPKDRQNCYIEVNEEKMYWDEGEAIVFDDTYKHRVYNNTNEPRIVLFIDIERPMIPGLKQFNQWAISQAPLVSFVKKVNDIGENTKDLKDPAT